MGRRPAWKGTTSGQATGCRRQGRGKSEARNPKSEADPKPEVRRTDAGSLICRKKRKKSKGQALFLFFEAGALPSDHRPLLPDYCFLTPDG